MDTPGPIDRLSPLWDKDTGRKRARKQKRGPNPGRSVERSTVPFLCALMEKAAGIELKGAAQATDFVFVKGKKKTGNGVDRIFVYFVLKKKAFMRPDDPNGVRVALTEPIKRNRRTQASQSQMSQGSGES